MDILRIDAQDTYFVRHKVLRPGRPIESTHFEGDSDEGTFHLGAAINGQLVSVASFYFRGNPLFEDEVQCQLRGMATLEEHQGKGLGAALLQAGIAVLVQNQCKLVWCNAREGAAEFYRRQGFELASDRFEIEGVGPHYVMFKRLS